MDNVVCLSHNANPLEKMRKKTEFKPVKLCLKINLVSHPACSGGG